MREPPIRVAFVDQVGHTPGGAERTLATFFRFVPSDIAPVAVLFEDGPFAEELRLTGAVVEIVPAPAALAAATREGGVLGGAVRAPSLIWRVAQTLRKHRPHLVYTNSMKAHVVGGLAARFTRTPCVIHFHDLFSGAPRTMLRTVARFASNERIACSQLVADSMNVGRTHVVYGPVEVAAYDALEERHGARRRLGLPERIPVIALIGRINRWKGHDRFVRIAARVNKALPVHFAIIGAPIFRDADFVPELEALVERLGLGERVSFHPWVDDIRSVYAAIDLNANCSTREPFGRTTAEAAAAGVPTICFADSGAAETIEDGVTGRLVEPGDEAEFARAVVEMLCNRKQRAAMAEAAKAAAVRFDAPRIANEMAEVMRAAAFAG
jgi:glycosyltransferase involved in cell wall biosynthesis